MINHNMSVPDLISVKYNFTDLKLEGFGMDPNVPLFDLVGND